MPYTLVYKVLVAYIYFQWLESLMKWYGEHD